MVLECVGAIDQGTQSTRFTLYDYSARIIAKFQVDIVQHRLQAGWCEHDPLQLWDSVRLCVEGALAAAQKATGDVRVVAVGITNQRETTLVWDRHTGQPLHNAVVWHDSRTAAICRSVTADLGADYFRPVTGLPVSTYFSAYKWRWLWQHVPAVAEAVAKGCCMLGTVDTWLLYKLSGGVNGAQSSSLEALADGVFLTDVTNASRTGLMDLQSLSWHAPTLRYFEIPISTLPEIRSNAEMYGRIASGPLAGVPIAGCLGDQQAAMLGQRCTPGTAKSTYGTGCFVLLHTGPRPVSSGHGLLTTMAYRLGPNAEPQYALEGAIATAGSAVSWLRDGLGLIGSVDELEPLARSVIGTAGVFFVPAFSGLLAPHWRSDARGAILGLTGSSSAGHVARALLEALAWQTREVVDAMRADAGTELKLLRVDGGCSRNGLLLQLQADTLQVEVQRPADMETTSLGAAFAAGIGSGFWTAEWVLGVAGQSAVPWQPDAIFLPKVSAAAAEARFRKWKRAVAHSLDLDQLAD